MAGCFQSARRATARGAEGGFVRLKIHPSALRPFGHGGAKRTDRHASVRQVERLSWVLLAVGLLASIVAGTAWSGSHTEQRRELCCCDSSHCPGRAFTEPARRRRRRRHGRDARNGQPGIDQQPAEPVVRHRRGQGATPRHLGHRVRRERGAQPVGELRSSHVGSSSITVLCFSFYGHFCFFANIFKIQRRRIEEQNLN